MTPVSLKVVSFLCTIEFSLFNVITGGIKSELEIWRVSVENICTIPELFSKNGDDMTILLPVVEVDKEYPKLLSVTLDVRISSELTTHSEPTY